MPTIPRQDIDATLVKGKARTTEEKSKFDSLAESSLCTFVDVNGEGGAPTSVYQFEGEDYREQHNLNASGNWIEPLKHERKASYAFDAYLNEALKARTQVLRSSN